MPRRLLLLPASHPMRRPVLCSSPIFFRVSGCRPDTVDHGQQAYGSLCGGRVSHCLGEHAHDASRCSFRPEAQ
eukprot:9188929-Heterocapsa_arctica.AAC.1